MRKSVSAILLKGENLVFMKREREGLPIYYTTLGGGMEQDENEIEALVRELLEESGSIIDVPVYFYKLIDNNSETIFYTANELNRTKPTGDEWTKRNSPTNKYEIVEVPKKQIPELNIVPIELKKFMMTFFKL